MIPEIGQHVKCFMRSGLTLEGIIIEWAAEIVLKSLDGENLMIVHHPVEDIMLTKIVLIEPNFKEKNQSTHQSEFSNKVKTKLAEVQLVEEDSELKEKTLDELKKIVRERERQIIASKKKEHFGTVGNAKLTHYSSPYGQMKSAYKPGQLPPWAYGRPPTKEK